MIRLVEDYLEVMRVKRFDALDVIQRPRFANLCHAARRHFDFMQLYLILLDCIGALVFFLNFKRSLPVRHMKRSLARTPSSVGGPSNTFSASRSVSSLTSDMSSLADSAAFPEETTNSEEIAAKSASLLLLAAVTILQTSNVDINKYDRQFLF